VGGGSAVEGSAISKGSADGENDAEGHCGGEDGSHGCDDSFDGICVIGGCGDEPEEHVNHVDDPDCSVEVQSITEHKLPVRNLLIVEGLE